MGFVLGLGGAYHHDASACLVRDGELIAYAEQERFSRRKHHKDSRSCADAVAFCLDRAGITLPDVDEVVIGANPSPIWSARCEETDNADLIAELLDPRVLDGPLPKRLAVVDHHRAHAASAFHCSGFTDAAILVVDGSGDGISTTIAHGTAVGIRDVRRIPFTQSLGWFYESAAEHLGLGDHTSAGKLMGLAAYGRPVHDLAFLRPEPGGYRLDLTPYGMPPNEDVAAQYADLRYYRRLKTAYRAAFTDAGVPAHRRPRHWDPARARTVGDPGFTPAHADLAASVQHRLEECLLSLAEAALKATGSTRLCIAGWVGLNCSANGALSRLPGVRDLFVQPAAGDGGTAIGAALERAHQRGELTLPAPRMDHTAWGPEFTPDHIHAVLTTSGLPFADLGDALPTAVANMLAHGAVAGWFQGRAEAGPRALGRRSILADPRATATRDRVNTIKDREPWRPLAPVIRAADAPTLIGTDTPRPFMIVADTASATARATMPGAVHIDHTVRAQTVTADPNDPYSRLLDAFAHATGVPALLNTSFNHAGEPVVGTPHDAIRTFAASSLDILAIGPFLLHKPAR